MMFLESAVNCFAQCCTISEHFLRFLILARSREQLEVLLCRIVGELVMQRLSADEKYHTNTPPSLKKSLITPHTSSSGISTRSTVRFSSRVSSMLSSSSIWLVEVQSASSVGRVSL
jgi:hypothetical protein